jgi:hypothetical protein
MRRMQDSVLQRLAAEAVRLGADTVEVQYDDGLHMLLPGDAPSDGLLDQLSEQYQQNIRKSPLWDEIVRRFGREEAERILKAFRVQVR